MEAASLRELGAVPWRTRLDARRLRQDELTWTATMVAHVVPFLGAPLVLLALEPLTFPMLVLGALFAYGLPALYANRGAKVVLPRPAQGAAEERTALGLLGDLIGHEARDVHARTGLVPERGRFGVWLVGEAGALLVRPGGRVVSCWCVRVEDPDLPRADRTSHLLLALREDEAGFATVANMAFAGARWRVRRRLPRSMRPAVDHAARLARALPPTP